MCEGVMCTHGVACCERCGDSVGPMGAPYSGSGNALTPRFVTSSEFACGEIPKRTPLGDFPVKCAFV
jgi:hypothetical protein